MSQSIDKKTLARIAKLAHLKEADSFALGEDMAAILAWMEELNEVDVSGAAPLAHPMELAPVMREDNPDKPLDPETALGSAPESQSGFFTTPKTNE